MVEPLIRDQLNDDKRMFYVDNVALKVPDLSCRGYCCSNCRSKTCVTAHQPRSVQTTCHAANAARRSKLNEFLGRAQEKKPK